MFVSGGDEVAWVPAGLAASVVLLVALSAREVVMRRAWTRYLLDQEDRDPVHRDVNRKVGVKHSYSHSRQATAIRNIQKRSLELDVPGTIPELHLELFNLCKEYLSSTDEALRSSRLSSDKRITLRAGQERVKVLQKHHLLTWARDSSRSLTHQAQQKARTSDKIETANKALECLDKALKIYSDEVELIESKLAVREFIASIKVGHWVELAERAAFKGHYRRAIARYQDALFYLLRESVKDETRISGAERINRQIESLRARLGSSGRQGKEYKE